MSPDRVAQPELSAVCPWCYKAVSGDAICEGCGGCLACHRQYSTGNWRHSYRPRVNPAPKPDK